MRRFLALFSLVLTGYFSLTINGAIVIPPSGGGGGSGTNAVGTAGHLTQFEGTNNLRDSIVTFQGTTNITVPGTLSVNGVLIRATGVSSNELSIAIGSNNAGNGATNTGNVAIGSGALSGLTTGNSNLGIGKNAGAGLDTGYDNTIMGTSAGGGGSSRLNTAIGKRALSASTTSSNNVAIGTGASSGSISGSGAGITTGIGNVILGYASGGITTGSRNVLIGDWITAANATTDNQLIIQNAIFGTGLEGTNSVLSTGKIGIMTNAPGYTLDVGGNLGVLGTSSLIGAVSASSLAVTNNETVGGTLAVTGATTLKAAVTMPSLTVTNDASINGTLFSALPTGSGTATYEAMWNSSSVLRAGSFLQSGNYRIPGTNAVLYSGSSSNAPLEIWIGGPSTTITNLGLMLGSVPGRLKLKGTSTTSSNSISLHALDTDASNYERLVLAEDSVGPYIGMEAAGTGSYRPMRFGNGGTNNQLTLNTNGGVTGVLNFVVTTGSKSIYMGTGAAVSGDEVAGGVFGITGDNVLFRGDITDNNTSMLQILSRANSAFKSVLEVTNTTGSSPVLVLMKTGGQTHAGGVITSTGLSSSNVTASVAITSTGWTNSFGANAVVYAFGVGIVGTIYNSAGTAIYTNASSTAFTYHLQPSGKVIITAGTGVAGIATPF